MDKVNEVEGKEGGTAAQTEENHTTLASRAL
jgi:hypothetical protein